MFEALAYIRYLLGGMLLTYLMLDTQVYTWWQYLIMSIVYIFPPNIQHYFNIEKYIKQRATIVIIFIILQPILPRSIRYIFNAFTFIALKSHIFSSNLDPNYSMNLIFFHYGVTLCLISLNMLTRPLIMFLMLSNIAGALVCSLLWTKRRVVGFTDYE